MRVCEANRAIVGTSGVAARGAYITDVEAGAVFAAMIERATETIVVADHSKFDQLAVVVFARWHSVDRLVTDRRPAGALATALRDAGTDVVVRA